MIAFIQTNSLNISRMKLLMPEKIG